MSVESIQLKLVRANRDMMCGEIERLTSDLAAAKDKLKVTEHICSSAIKTVDELQSENKRLREALDRDKTGLCHALNRIREEIRAYNWIVNGEWGCYSYEKRTEETLRTEIKTAFTAMYDMATEAINESAKLAKQALSEKPK